MYNMYTMSEFRDNLRKAFNAADEGHEVVIDRYGQLYQLVSLVNGPLPGHSFEATPEGVKPTEPTSITNPTNPSQEEIDEETRKAFDAFAYPSKAIRKALNLCKVHGTPLDGRGKCLQKGCRYA